MFLNVWGAGPVAANNWIAQGFQTLEDVKEKGAPTKLDITIETRIITVIAIYTSQSPFNLF